MAEVFVVMVRLSAPFVVTIAVLDEVPIILPPLIFQAPVLLLSVRFPSSAPVRFTVPPVF